MKSWIAILCLFASPVFAQAPSTGYISGTPDAPSTDGETGFSFIVVIDSSFTDFWAEAENTNADRGRVYRNDGTTKLNCDWIEYDHAGQSAVIRFNDTAALSPTTYRIYPPVAANAQDDTSASAYDASWAGYWPLGAGADRTSNSRDMTATGITAGDSTGKLAAATDYDGTTGEYASYTAAATVAEDPFTMIVWLQPDAQGSSGVLSLATSNTVPWAFLASRDFGQFRVSDGVVNNIDIDGGDMTTTGTGWNHLAARASSNTSRFLFFDGTKSTESTTAVDVTGMTQCFIGCIEPGTWHYNGRLCDAQIHSVARSDEWIAYEYAQTNDNAAFWNTWTWNAGSSGPAINPISDSIPGSAVNPIRTTIP